VRPNTQGRGFYILSEPTKGLLWHRSHKFIMMVMERMRHNIPCIALCCLWGFSLLCMRLLFCRPIRVLMMTPFTIKCKHRNWTLKQLEEVRLVCWVSFSITSRGRACTIYLSDGARMWSVMLWARVSQTWSWRAAVLQSLAPTLVKHTYLWLSTDPEDLDELAQVCLIRVGAKLCRTVTLQVWVWETLLWAMFC